jgi:hypothetical protein
MDVAEWPDLQPLLSWQLILSLPTSTAPMYLPEQDIVDAPTCLPRRHRPLWQW